MSLRFQETPLAGAYVIDQERVEDERGFFARCFCARAFAEHGLVTGFVQMNASLSRSRGTLRGLHCQLPPSAEVKLVRVVTGGIWDVILDLRAGSTTFGRHFGVELSAANRRALYVPEGFAHGFVTLEADTEAVYLVSAFYDPRRERGIRWDDPRFAIPWPLAPAVISAKDRSLPDFDETRFRPESDG